MIRWTGFVIGVTASVLCSQSAVIAAQRGGGLRGITEVGILVLDMHDDARKCNVSNDGLDAAVRLPMSTSLLKVARDARPYVSVYSNVMQLQDGLCVASFEVTVRRWSTEFGEFVSVWEKGGIITGRASTFGTRVHDSVEELAKLMIAAWLKAND